MRTACKQITGWNGDAGAMFPVSVNLSLLQFRHNDLVGMVSDAIQEHSSTPAT